MAEVVDPRARAKLADCEQVIERGLRTFAEVGLALLAIRDERLYRGTHATFEDYCQQRWGMSRRHANRLVEGAAVAEILGPIGPKPGTESQARELAPLLDDPGELRDVWEETLERTEGKPTARDIAEVRDERRPHVANNSGDNEWYTPAPIIEAARAAMGGIDLDPASCAEANAVVRAAHIWTIADDGLDQPWKGRIWCNPPYARGLVEKFASCLVSHWDDGDIEAACLLVNNATDTAWWQAAARDAEAVCFLAGRVRYWQPGRETNAPLQGQTVLYYGPDTAAFTQAFDSLGLVLI